MTIAIMLFTSMSVLYLNYHNRVMNLMSYYEDFRRIIAAGFNPAAGVLRTPTFPMWGYGFVLTITQVRVFILSGQAIIAVAVTIFFLRTLSVKQFISKQSYRFASVLMSVSLPWFAFHSGLTPYSFAISAFMMSFALLLSSVAESRHAIIKAILGGIFFGICLNFRSDFIFLPLVICLLICWATHFRPTAAIRSALFGLSCYTMLLPWAVYSHRATGHYLFTSTNSGHVMFISLGSLRNNPWGITPSDADPQMAKTLRDHFGKPVSSLVYESQPVLNAAFLNNIKKEPAAFFKKLVSNAYLMSTRGVYPGEFYEESSCDPECFAIAKDHSHQMLANPFRLALWQDMDLNFRLGAEVISLVMGTVVVFLSFITLPITIALAVRRRLLFETVLCGCILYQAALQVFTYNITLYTTNMYMLHILNLSIIVPYLLPRVGPPAVSKFRLR
jgi:hypothetical protein